MGQYYTIYNIDKFQSLGHMGKLGEFFADAPRAEFFVLLGMAGDPANKLTGSWIGDRIICAGDYTEPGDYPTGLFSEQEMAEMAEVDPNSTFRNCYEYRNISQRLPTMDEEIMGPNPEWVLLNISKRQYVRENAIAHLNMADHGPAGCMAHLGHALLSHICWSSQPNGLGCREDICRGSWAGSAFEITTLDRMEQHGGKPWIDVSDEMVGWLEELAE
ncbi:hypothetical protein BD779DRAFT_1803146 [Infundibulicybe gibba]|nr:hypothetical protein BD779DRAFT_1803146 [Infundibulicybe gibba]